MKRRQFFAALLTTALTFPAWGGWKEAPVDITMPAKVQTTGSEQVLVAMFRGSPNDRVDVGLEVSRWIRREIARETRLTVIEAPPPEIPEQRPDKLAVNDAFWRRLGEDFKADLIVAGVAEFKVEDRSGFVDEDFTSPATGQTIRRSRFAERKGYRLHIEIFFLKGDNGALLPADSWTEDRLVQGDAVEDLQELYDLLEAMKGHLLAELLPTKTQEPRYIWVE